MYNRNIVKNIGTFSIKKIFNAQSPDQNALDNPKTEMFCP